MVEADLRIEEKLLSNMSKAVVIIPTYNEAEIYQLLLKSWRKFSKDQQLADANLGCR